jgi:hypothetical protein
MRKWVAVAVVGVALVGQAGGAGASGLARSSGALGAVAAKTCPAGFTHALIGGQQKCLHAGEYCAHSEARQYRRYHFVCERVRGTYRLERS